MAICREVQSMPSEALAKKSMNLEEVLDAVEACGSQLYLNEEGKLKATERDKLSLELVDAVKEHTREIVGYLVAYDVAFVDRRPLWQCHEAIAAMNKTIEAKYVEGAVELLLKEEVGESGEQPLRSRYLKANDAVCEIVKKAIENKQDPWAIIFDRALSMLTLCWEGAIVRATLSKAAKGR